VTASSSRFGARTFVLDRPLDVRATVGGLSGGGASGRRAADGIWRATNTPEGPATVHVDDRHAEPYRPGGVVRVRAWGAGAGWALEHADQLLGLDDDPESFDPDHPVLAEAHRRRPGVRFSRSLALTEALVPIILHQKVQTVAAQRSWRRIVFAYGSPAPGPVAGLRLPPTAERLAALPYQALHRFDVERRRADTIRRVCRLATSIDRLATRPGADPVAVQRALTTIDGVGAWTAASACQAAMGAADAVVVGDYHLPHIVGWVLAGEPRATDERMLELLAPYVGHRARAQRLAMRSGAAPRYGPRLAIRTFADC
jgi:3-methyladenine DNA glycosylase/8-oxoguanine DNA glycosylase